jgi:hypothetical protein
MRLLRVGRLELGRLLVRDRRRTVDAAAFGCAARPRGVRSYFARPLADLASEASACAIALA